MTFYTNNHERKTTKTNIELEKSWSKAFSIIVLYDSKLELLWIEYKDQYIDIWLIVNLDNPTALKPKHSISDFYYVIWFNQ